MKKAEKMRRLEATIEEFYHQKKLAPALVETILYSVQAGGKRLRPLLFLELLEGWGLELSPAHFQVAAAVELVHTASLIHDDLPAMDDDDYRRGRLTSHKKFGEALAILAGDSLFLDPFAFLAMAELPSQIKVDLVAALSQAAGTFGMVAGQVLDMQGEGQQVNLEELKTIHTHKTGKLLAFPFLAAALVTQIDHKSKEKLVKVGELLGLAFQVRDDILDVTASFDQLGKTPQKDLLADKSTYPALLGLAEAQLFLQDLLDQTQGLLAQLEEDSSFEAQAIQEMIEGLRL